MLVIGLILLIVGAALLHFFPDRFAQFAGVILLVIGLVLAVLGALDVADVRLSD